jgi:hypothetical protein
MKRAQWTAYLERLTTTLRDAGHDPVVLRALELNHCSTTRDSKAASAANRSLRPTASDLAKQGQESRRPAQGAVIPDRSAHETWPNGPGLTCEFDGGRCWVRTNRGLPGKPGAWSGY